MASKLKGKKPTQRANRRAKILIYGKSGVGKTTFALNFPDNYYIDSESGAREKEYVESLLASGALYVGQEDGANDFTEVIGQFKALATEKHDRKTVIDDSVSKLFNTALSQEQERLGDKDQYGASKKAPIAQMRQLLNWVTRIDMNVVFIAHEKDEYGLVGGQREAVGSTFDCWDRLEYELDLVLRIEKNAGKRQFRVRKSRLKEFEEGKTFPATFEEFAKRFGESDIYGEVATVELASAEQVASIKRLVHVLHIPEEETQKWLVKASANSFEDFSTEHAAKTIAFLNAKIVNPEEAA